MSDSSSSLAVKPLSGLRVAVTRDPSQAGALSELLRAQGAEPVELPLIEIQAAGDPGPLDEAILRLAAYDWIVFTSANAVRFFRARLSPEQSLTVASLPICVIGGATRAAVEAEGWTVGLMPERAQAEGVVEAFDKIMASSVDPIRVLFPAAAAARDVVPVRLRNLGARVDVVEAYRTVASERGAKLASAMFGREGLKPDWVTLASPSAVKALLTAVGRDGLKGVRVASIGPVTSDALGKHGVSVNAEAMEQSGEGLVRAIVDAGR